MAERRPEEEPSDLDDLLEFVRESRGFDFTGYKRASLSRRVQKRMGQMGVETYAAYRELLESDSDEFALLFNTILINVTSFMRDRDAWEQLSRQVLPQIEQEKGPGATIRAWCAGCASGEEVYTLAVLLCDALGEERFRESVKLYGTDADEEALAQARQGRYSSKALQEAFSEEQLARYFERSNGSASFRADLRRMLIFGPHDLVRDPPISRIDLLVCRNTLMYFNAEVQQRVLRKFHFALNFGGFLFLGKSEALVNRLNLFSVEDLGAHIFTKPRRDTGKPSPPVPPPVELEPTRAVATAPMLQTVFEFSPVAQVSLDSRGLVIALNRRARELLSLGRQHLGRPFSDLELSYRPVELRSRIDEAIREQRPVTISEVEMVLSSSSVETLDIHVVPGVVDGAVSVISLTFEEVGLYKRLREELERSQEELEAAYEELQSAVEELETTNEELQSTNEELETTNEELQSTNEELETTNEELETMNEELQSTNEELETINTELRSSTTELDELSSFLQAILSSFTQGVVVLNTALGIRVWNRQAEDMWGLRADEVEGGHFLNLDIGLPVQQLREAVRACLNGTSLGEQLVVAAMNRRGRAFPCRVGILPLRREAGVIDGVILLMEDSQGVPAPPAN